MNELIPERRRRVNQDGDTRRTRPGLLSESSTEDTDPENTNVPGAGS